MWMLVRSDSGATPAPGGTTLAGSPDTPGRGDPWRWTVRLVDPAGQDVEAADGAPPVGVTGHGGAVVRHVVGSNGVDEPDGAGAAGRAGAPVLELLVDPAHVVASADLHTGGLAVDLVREPGSELVVVPLQGEALVADSAGPWRRWLSPGDVFVVEGEEPESLRLTPAPEPSRVAVLRLNPIGDQPLRWVP